MKIVCLSASNIEPFRASSASTRACELVRDLVQAQPGFASVEVEILPLIDYELKPCRMCGKCLPTGRCARDEAFNQLQDHLAAADAIFVVCPHYALIPSKLMIILEKMQEISYLHWCQDNSYRLPYAGKPLGLVAHGGQTAEALPYYRKSLLDPLATICASVGLRVVGAGVDEPTGVVFGITSLSMPKDSIFVTIEHDWNDIRHSLAPLVRNVLAQV